ncbi:MAG TPA: MBL fold metallo-hydrolase [Brevundimonas sp.]|jgi:glyoxylase-like metal-dependent hydrolase (beta-lactamase superfamily II)
MKIHHLNCGTDCPFGGHLMDGRSKGPLARLVCHCLLIETPASGLVLVDTGYGMQDVSHPHPRISRTMRSALNIRLRERETALRQVEALGFSARDVRHIVLTHLDFDHAGGIEDFPEARVHLMREELDAGRARRGGLASNKRYRPMQFDRVRDWRPYAQEGSAWFGFGAVRNLDGLPPEVLMIPLPGHTWGHAGVAVSTQQGWLLHAGDAYFHADEMRRPDRRCPPGLRAYQTLMEVDRGLRLENQARLRRLSLKTDAGVQIICAHDAAELDDCIARSGARHG